MVMFILTFHKRRPWVLLIGLILNLYVAPIAATDLLLDTVHMPAGVKSCGTGKVATVLSGDRFQLENGGMVSLAEVKAPEYWSPEAPHKSWPLSHDAKAALTAALKKEPLEFFCSGQAKSAQGELIAHVRTGSGRWVQLDLVKDGFVYFMPHGQPPRLASRLRTVEAEARAGKRGIWAHESLGVKLAEGDELRPGWFQVIVGKVTSEAKRKDRMYLNFGDDWSRDFTIEIPSRLYRSLPEITGEQGGFFGKTVEVRGWVEWAGGPKIILEFAEQLIVMPGIKNQRR